MKMQVESTIEMDVYFDIERIYFEQEANKLISERNFSNKNLIYVMRKNMLIILLNNLTIILLKMINLLTALLNSIRWSFLPDCFSENILRQSCKASIWTSSPKFCSRVEVERNRFYYFQLF